MKPARSLLKKGNRVRLSDVAIKAGLGQKSQTGVVIGTNSAPGTIRILRDGLKCAETWNQSFWELDT